MITAVMMSWQARTRKNEPEAAEEGGGSSSATKVPPTAALDSVENDETSAPATPTAISRCQSISHSLLITMVPSVRDESVWITGTLIRVKW